VEGKKTEDRTRESLDKIRIELECDGTYSLTKEDVGFAAIYI